MLRIETPGSYAWARTWQTVLTSIGLILLFAYLITNPFLFVPFLAILGTLVAFSVSVFIIYHLWYKHYEKTHPDGRWAH